MISTQGLSALALLSLLTGACSGGSGSGTSAADAAGPQVDARVGGNTNLVMMTTLGEVSIEVLEDKAPVTAANFLRYVNEGYFDGQDGMGATHFHRVISGFMVQGGGFTADGSAKAAHAPIANEAAASGLSNERGTLAMARTSEPDSATSQFYINVVDNDFLDAAPGEPGYAVFAVVTAGMDVVDEIAGVATDGGDQPTVPVVIESIAIAE